MYLQRQILKSLVIISVFLLALSSICKGCNAAEYKIGLECCPMCAPGLHVYKHCTEHTSTSCVPCTGSTFTDKPNGATECSACTLCDHGLGLKTTKECTPSSNTVCGALEGNYCIDPYEGGCRAARKYTTCKPGQFIKHPGTLYNDTVCEECPERSFSDGSSTSCASHTDCESKGLPTLKPGDSVSDSQCGDDPWDTIVPWITTGIVVLLLAGGGAIGYYFYLRRKRNRPDPEQLQTVPVMRQK